MIGKIIATLEICDDGHWHRPEHGGFAMSGLGLFLCALLGLLEYREGWARITPKGRTWLERGQGAKG
jgi:hypothetical protein